MDFQTNKRRKVNKRNRRRNMLVRSYARLTIVLFLMGLFIGRVVRAGEEPKEETKEEMIAEETIIESDLENITQAAGQKEILTTEDIEVKEIYFVPLPVDMTEEDQRIVFEIATENDIAFTLVMALIGCESEFDKNAYSATGDSGYMQINDCNIEEMENRGFEDMFDTADNVGAGVSILRELYDTYGDETERVLMAYNMGAGNASKLWDQGIVSSEYSRKIVAREREYSNYIDAQKGFINAN